MVLQSAGKDLGADICVLRRDISVLKRTSPVGGKQNSGKWGDADDFMWTVGFMASGYGLGMQFESAGGVCDSRVAAIEEPRSQREASGPARRQDKCRGIVP